MAFTLPEVAIWVIFFPKPVTFYCLFNLPTYFRNAAHPFVAFSRWVSIKPDWYLGCCKSICGFAITFNLKNYFCTNLINLCDLGFFVFVFFFFF